MPDVPAQINQLVDTFRHNIDTYKSSAYNEAQLRQEFINPFFEQLGWDVNNEKAHAHAYKDVIHEDAIKIAAATKAPDYSFRIGGTRKFFLEAKKPSVNIKSDIHPAYQLRRYAWSANLPLSILTDFEEFAVYDCTKKPNPKDKPSTARIFYYNYTDYPDQWHQIADIFARESILKGSFDKFAASAKRKRGTSPVDDEFLKEIESWRDSLAANIALRNKNLSVYDLNFAVQKTIDRILFLRMCEDRRIEQYAQLLSLTSGDNIYPRLCTIFTKADAKYNSGLFHFSKEKDRHEEPDELSLNLQIDDDKLKNIIKNLYYPHSPYEFSVLPTEILGSVYERFLGKVITLTPAHRARVEQKPEVRKAGGVYYTPSYIVDYIVKNTVGKLIQNKSPRHIDRIKILDPACGSGSFLIGAYTRLLDYHRDYYLKNPDKNSNKFYQGKGGAYHLTIAEKKRILLNNIFGVDIDTQAVEVTKLSLLLKVLEDESQETIGQTYRMFHERALPDLDANIKCGNSLIGPDFYDNTQLDLFDEHKIRKINAFDFKSEFPKIFSQKTPGFNAVIGNPPYVRQEGLAEFKNYFLRKYKTYIGTSDLYVPFIEKGVNLLNKNGRFAYIVANKWMRANYGKPLREWLLNQGIEEIIDFGDLPVFQGATTYPCILTISKTASKESFTAADLSTLDFTDLADHVSDNSFTVTSKNLSLNGWTLLTDDQNKLIDKIKSNGIPLQDYVEGKIYYGIKTGLNKAFVINDQTRRELIDADPKSKEIIKPFLAGRDIHRYVPPEPHNYIIFLPKGWTNHRYYNQSNKWQAFCSEFPAAAKYLAQFQKAAQKRYDKGDYWWELRACHYYSEFEKPKLIYPNICKSPQFTFDDHNFFTNQKCFIIARDDKYLLAVLNSSLMKFLFRHMLPRLRGGYYEPSYFYFSKFPICSPRNHQGETHQLIDLVNLMLDLNEKLQTAKTAHHKDLLKRQINATDKQIDNLTYKLYNLTEKEIEIIENS